MEITEIMKLLKDKIPEENIKQNELMKNHTSFKIGGPAEIFLKIKKIEEIQQILEITSKNKIPLTIVGNGTNLLVTDKGIRGIVAKIELNDIEIKKIDDVIEVSTGSGMPIGLLAQKLLKQEITGFEELSGIPGTIGGAITMNAGAHGKEIKDIVQDIIALDYSGKIHTFSNEQAKFDYRYSRFLDEKYIIISSKLILSKGKENEIKEKMNEYMQYRKDKQPIEYPSAGSTFKRGNDFITAKLIDDAGLKGYKIGGAEISEKHAGFIINKGNATCKNVIDLINYTTEIIYKKYGKKIYTEIQVIGEK